MEALADGSKSAKASIPDINSRSILPKRINRSLQFAPLTRTQRAFRWLLVFAWMGIIYFLSSRPDLPTPDNDLLADIFSALSHAFVFGVLMGLLLRAMSGGLRRVSRGQALLAFALTMTYALTDEFHQSFVPNRTPDMFDVIVDAIGAGVALGIWHIVVRPPPHPTPRRGGGNAT